MLANLVTAFVGGFWLSILIVGLKTIRKSMGHRFSGVLFGVLLAMFGGYGVLSCSARLFLLTSTRTAQAEDQIVSRQLLAEEKILMNEHYVTKSNGVCVNNRIQSLKTDDLVNLDIMYFRGRKIGCEIMGLRKP